MSVIRAIARSMFNGRRSVLERPRSIPVAVRAEARNAPPHSARRRVLRDSYLYGYLPS